MLIPVWRSDGSAQGMGKRRGHRPSGVAVITSDDPGPARPPGRRPSKCLHTNNAQYGILKVGGKVMKLPPLSAGGHVCLALVGPQTARRAQ